MVLAFETLPIRELCESDSVARAELGDERASRLQQRIADLMAAQSLSDLPVGGPDEAPQEAPWHMSLPLDDGHILVAPNHHEPPLTTTGELDLARVSRIRILEVHL